MTRYAIAGAVILSLAACASGPAHEGPSGALNLNLNGDGRWEINCSAVTIRGRTVRVRERARGSRDFGKVFLDDVVSASCEYAAGNAPLLVRVTEDGLSCPFGTYQDGCNDRFDANASGSFELSARS